ncbi:hypothetical protein HB763_03870 [Vibrio campbellii]|uniref:hypothetical protein n=1 Tax=Vibrio campbellii TaxID=680 RepID=UPI00210F1ACD|nr:hypothetical protein [Vibrio campbellii]UTZ35914.1 hypothetical protein HB763_03870 [Vibrio campbellii]
MSKVLPNEFDQTLSQPTERLITNQTHLFINNKAILFNNRSVDAKTLYQATCRILISEWWQTLGAHTQRNYRNNISAFLTWLNKHEVNNTNRLDLLNEYQAYRVNEVKVKPQSSGLHSMQIMLRESLTDNTLTTQQQNYIKLLTQKTHISNIEPRVPDTLTAWFAQIDWLQPIVGQSTWLAMESPKRLMASFSVTISSTLLWVSRVKSAIRKLISDSPCLNKIDKGLASRQRDKHYSRELLTIVHKNSKDLPLGSLELLLTDFVNPTAFEEVKLRLNNDQEVCFIGKVDGKRTEFIRKPSLFSPEYLETNSPLEQLLAAWLCAWQTIQPNDISKLTPNNFCIHYNKQNRPTGVQCVYYKGRSGIQEPQFLEATLVEAKALITYLKNSPNSKQLLFPNKQTHKSFSPLSSKTMNGSLTQLFELPVLSEFIQTQLQARSISDDFRHLYLTIAHHSSSSYPIWSKAALKNQQSYDIETYRNKVARPLPQLMFGLSAIKTSSVQARSDRYRDGDLININSHSIGTEKTGYMTDQNKEWVNQNGRITRIVLDDIEHHAYKPNINTALNLARERRLQTQIMQETANQEVRINPLGQVITTSTEEMMTSDKQSLHIVWDTPETVVYFLHYLSEAERQANRLIEHALQYFELTVLPDAEWMSSLLNNGLSPKTIRLGRKSYKKLHEVLPPLFENQIQGSGSI